MAKKLLALLLSMCMLLSVCSISIYAEESAGTGEEGTTEATAATEGTTEATEKETEKEAEEETEEKKVVLDMENSYLPNASVTVTGRVYGDVEGVEVLVTCDNDRFELDKTLSVSKFESTGVKFNLEGATVGVKYIVQVYDFNTGELLAKDTFLIERGTTGNKDDDGSNKVTIWIEGLTGRYIDETVVSLDKVDEQTVFGVAEYVLEEEGRNYKDNKKKITAVATTATGSTYLRDNSTTKNQQDCEWGYFVNGIAYYDIDMVDMEVNGGDEIILYYGKPGEVGYPIVTITPDDGIGLNDTVTILVENQVTDIETGEVTVEPIKGAKVYLLKRNATSLSSGKSTDSKGIYSVTANTSFISSYQGGHVMAAYYQTSSKPPVMVSVKYDLETERDGTVQAWVRVEGAHKTLLERTKSAKVEEYDLLNFAMEVFDDEKIDYELNRDKSNFEYIESKATTGYSNENGDLTRDSGWYVVVNDVIYTPDDDLEDVVVFSNDEIMFYFGDKDTVPVVYYTIDGDLETEERVYVYFYSDANKTDPIEDLDVYFDGDEYNSKRLTTNSEGRVTLPTVEYKGTYELSWGEQVGVKDDECPSAVMGSIDLTYKGTAKPKEEEETEKKTEKKTERYDDEDDEDEDDWDDWDTVPTEKPTKGWEEGDYTEPPTERPTGPSPYFPDQDISGWALDGVNKAYEYGLMNGTDGGYFAPHLAITRAEFATIISRMLGLDVSATSNYTQVFTDVRPGEWYFNYVMAAYNAGYVNGMSATSFSPNSYINREQMAVIIAKIIQVTGQESEAFLFADGASISAWARIYVAAVNKTGLMTGNQFGEFMPAVYVTRETAAVVAIRLLEYLNS